jgi:alpha-L-arabinofuranosidase
VKTLSVVVPLGYRNRYVFLKMRPFMFSLALPLVSAVAINVASSGGNATSGRQYGFLHEDINNSGDGGIYAELIRNRAFQYSDQYPLTLDGWRPVGNAKLETNRVNKPLSDALPVSVNVSPRKSNCTARKNTPGGGSIGLLNEGWWGMAVEEKKYTVASGSTVATKVSSLLSCGAT